MWHTFNIIFSDEGGRIYQVSHYKRSFETTICHFHGISMSLKCRAFILKMIDICFITFMGDTCSQDFYGTGCVDPQKTKSVTGIQDLYANYPLNRETCVTRKGYKTYADHL